jgi:hypothetical protein
MTVEPPTFWSCSTSPENVPGVVPVVPALEDVEVEVDAVAVLALVAVALVPAVNDVSVLAPPQPRIRIKSKPSAAAEGAPSRVHLIFCFIFDVLRGSPNSTAG